MPWARLIAALALGALLAWTGIAVPAPAGPNAGAKAFSSARAMTDIRVIAARPHPIGSTDNRRVRDYLLGRMAALGLTPRVQRSVRGAVAMENLVGVLPGKDRAAPALALMAHYDSMPISPGAGDDAAGMATILETGRAIEAAGATPARDIVVVFTDGEERGLLGAKALFAGDPIVNRIGLVINLDTRGSGGRALMYQTSPQNGALVAALRRAAVAPIATSLADFAYRHMPNDTDLTVALANGKQGYNFAFIGRQADYHTATATPDRLDQGSVQSMGRQVLKLTKALAYAPALPGRAPDRVYSQAFGDLILAYPPLIGWLVWGAGAGLVIWAAVRPRGELKLIDAAIGLAAGPVLILLTGLALWAARKATGIGRGFQAQQPLLEHYNLWEVALLAVCLAVFALLLWLLRARASRPGVWLGLLVLACIAGAALQAAAPLAANLLTWPLLVATAAAMLSRLGQDGRAAPWIVILCAVSIGWIAPIGHFVLEGFNDERVLAVFVWLCALSLWPLAAAALGRTRPAA